MADISPVDFATPLARAQTLVPDYVQQQLQRKLGALQTQNFALQNTRAQQQIDEANSQAQNETAFETAISDLGANPTPDRYRALAARFPKFAPGINQAAKGMEDSQRVKTLGDLAQVHSALGANRPELARAIIQRHTDADKAAGREPDPSDAALLAMIDSGDPAQIKAARGFAYSTMNAMDPAVAKNLTEAGISGGVKGQVVGRAIGHYNDDGVWTTDYRDPEPTEYKSVGAGDTLVAVGGEGGGQASSGGAAGTRGDVSRLINTDAGGGYVPEGVKTLGQFVAFGRDLNRRGAKSSSAGTYQINGTTMAEFAPKALGEGWRNVPFDASAQEKVGEAIFNWAKQQPDPAKALRGRWVSLDAGEAGRLVQGNWQQARGTIAQGETGGGAGASAAAPRTATTQGGARIIAQGAPKAGSSKMTPDEVKAEGLDPAIVYYRDSNGVPQALSGQSRPTRQALQLTEGQAKATGLLNSMVAAQNALNTVSGYEPSIVALALNDLSNKNPVKRNLSQTDRRVLNAQLAFANSILRLESGAAIGKDEAATKAQTLFPMPGDGPEVQADKRRQREAALASMRAGSGPGSASVAKVIPNAAERGPRQVHSIQEARALPPGTVFLDPRGIRRVR